MMAHAYHHSTWVSEAGGLQVQDCYWLQNEFQVSLGNMIPCLKIKKK